MEPRLDTRIRPYIILGSACYIAIPLWRPAIMTMQFKSSDNGHTGAHSCQHETGWQFNEVDYEETNVDCQNDNDLLTDTDGCPDSS